MSAHPQLSRDDASEIVKYILSLSTSKPPAVLPSEGNIVLKDHVGQKPTGRYIIAASYTDQGGAISPLTTREVWMLRPSIVQVNEADKNYNMGDWGNTVYGKNRSWFLFKSIDLKDIKSLSVRFASESASTTLSVRLDSLKGREIGTIPLKGTNSFDKFVELTGAMSDPGDRHDLYFVLTGKDDKGTRLDWVRFN